VSTTNTSRDAAQTIAPTAATLRQRVLDAIIDAGQAGLTDDEIQAHLGMPGNTERPRRRELEDAGRITNMGTRLNWRGNLCRVWIAL
jgi:hypothetical protein